LPFGVASILVTLVT